MYEDYIYIDEKTLRKYIKIHGKKLLGRDYEIGAGIIMLKFFEVENCCKCLIGFKLNKKYGALYNLRTKPLNLEEFKYFFENHIDENDPYDLVISPTDSIYKKNQKLLNSAWRLQLKRFGHFQKEKTTEGLINVLDKICKKYAPSNGFLVFLFDGHKGINLHHVHEFLNTKNPPFTMILFINPTKTGIENKWVIKIGEMWPGFGHNEYDPKIFKFAQK